MKPSALFTSIGVLCTSVIFIGCGSSTSGSDTENTTIVSDSFRTSGIIDLKDYIPQIDKYVTFLVSDSNGNVNSSSIYTSSDGLITVESNSDGLDLDDYSKLDKFTNLDSGYREVLSSIEFGSNYLRYTIDQEETLKPRYYDNNDIFAMTIQFAYISNFSASTGDTTTYYTEAYESNSSFCHMTYVGDYNISGTSYNDAVELSCFANRTKGGTVNGTSTIAYDYNYTSTTILLPSMGIVSVDYKGVDTNYTITWRP